MRTFLVSMLAAVVSISLIACSGNDTSSKESGTTQDVSQQNTTEQAAYSQEPASEQPVHNEMVFDVPETYQKVMELKIIPNQDDGSGAFSIPKSAIESIDDHDAIFLSLGNNQFALRFVTIDEDLGSHIVVRQNMVVGEMIVTEGSEKLKAGILRKTTGHHGHTHGPGGHTH